MPIHECHPRTQQNKQIPLLCCIQMQEGTFSAAEEKTDQRPCNRSRCQERGRGLLSKKGATWPGGISLGAVMCISVPGWFNPIKLTSN